MVKRPTTQTTHVHIWSKYRRAHRIVLNCDKNTRYFETVSLLTRRQKSQSKSQSVSLCVMMMMIESRVSIKDEGSPSHHGHHYDATVTIAPCYITRLWLLSRNEMIHINQSIQFISRNENTPTSTMPACEEWWWNENSENCESLHQSATNFVHNRAPDPKLDWMGSDGIGWDWIDSTEWLGARPNVREQWTELQQGKFPLEAAYWIVKQLHQQLQLDWIQTDSIESGDDDDDDFNREVSWIW